MRYTYPLAMEFPRTRAAPNPKPLKDLSLLSRGTCAARARDLKTTASRRRERSHRSRVPPPSYPREPTCPPPNRRCYDATAANFLSRSCPRDATARTTRPRAETTASQRRESSESSSLELSWRREAVVSALAQKGWAAQARHVCPPVPASRGLIFQHAVEKGGRGELPRRLTETRGGVR